MRARLGLPLLSRLLPGALHLHDELLFLGRPARLFGEPMLQVYQNVLGHGALVRVHGQGGEVHERVGEPRARRHDADEEGETVAGELVGDDEPHAEEVVAEEVDARRPAGRSVDLEFVQQRRRGRGRDDPEQGLDERLRGQTLLLASLVQRARLARALLPVREVLAQASAQLGAAQRVTKDVDEAEHRGDPSEQAEPGSLSSARGVGVVPQVGVLGVPRDLVLDDGGPGGVQGALADLLGELVEGVVHEPEDAPTVDQDQTPLDARAPAPLPGGRCTIRPTP